MNKTRLPILIIVVSLILTSVIAVQALANSSGNTSNRAGMGDLQRFEAQQALANTGDYASRRVGMGDLRRFEAQPAIVNADTSSPGTSNRVCPNSSTSYGEKDAGASAPANVLHAIGCGVPASK